MFSDRFQRPLQLTHHAMQRMAERDIDESRLHDLVETGTVKDKDETRLWLFKRYADRDDNLLCVAAILESAVVIKTVMHHFTPE